MDWNMIRQLPSRNMRQLAFFYLLCKIGVVRFNMKDNRHVEALVRMVDFMQAESKAIPLKEARFEITILMQIFKDAGIRFKGES